jgi:hypothetical protein
MMAFEGPYLAAIIARLPQPTFNLAAHGVAIAVAVLVESPVIMLMSASTALVRDAASYRKLRNFTGWLCAAVTIGMVVVVLPSAARLFLHDLVGLPDEVAELTRRALLFLLPWPAAIGYRRFYQGLLIRGGQTRLVAAGTLVRLGTMTAVGLALAVSGLLPGAQVGAAALASGVTVEAVVARTMARGTVAQLLGQEPAADVPALGYRRIAAFYTPLALTSVVGLTIDPMLTFFMGRSRLPVISLALYPVVDAFSFLFRAIGLSFQEAAIALLGDDLEHRVPVTRFAVWLGGATTAGLALMAFTPLAHVWYEHVSGLTPELSRLALPATMVLVLMPALTVLLSYQRGILVRARRTPPITASTVVEVLGVAVAFVLLDRFTGWTGVTVAMTAFVVGRCVGILTLLKPSVVALRGRPLDRPGGTA